MPDKNKGTGLQAGPQHNYRAPAILWLDPDHASKEKQRAVILEYLKSGELTTVDARERLGVLHPCGRVHELRKLGHDIETLSRTQSDAQGRLHRVACYVLRSGGDS